MKEKRSDFKIRPYEPTDIDIAAAVKFVNEVWPNQPSTVEIWKHNDSIRNPKRFDRRFVGEVDEEVGKRIVAMGFISDRIWAQKPGKYYIDIYIDKKYRGEGIDELFYPHLLANLADKQPTELGIGCKEDNVVRMKFLEQKGFKQTMRDPCSELDVPGFESNSFTAYTEKMASSGIVIYDLAGLQKIHPDWMQKLYDLEMVIERDVPDTDDFTPAGLEEYAKHFQRITFRADAWFVAVDGDDYVGMSSLWTNKVLDDVLSVGITGVLPSHRRRGIGTALKLKTIEFAQKYGARIIETGNEENNPMYTLNMNLGFNPTPAWLSFEKVL